MPGPCSLNRLLLNRHFASLWGICIPLRSDYEILVDPGNPGVAISGATAPKSLSNARLNVMVLNSNHVEAFPPLPSHIRYPDFFIIGAPKCGTTALYSYLRDHPQVFMPSLKEPQFFCSDFPGISLVSGPKGYEALFEQAPDTHIVGEGSVWYLYSKVAVPRIVDAAPDAKYIVMLRNPIEMARSLHAQFLLTLQEDEEDFERAWEKQADRLAGRCLPSYCPEPQILQYRETCALGSQLKRLFSHVDRSRVKVLFFDDFSSDTKAVYESVLEFLELAPDHRSDFITMNPRRVYAYPRVISLLRNPPGLLKPGIYLGKYILNRFGIRPIRYLRRYLTRPAASAPLDPAFRSRLLSAFRADIELLESIMSVRLDHWKK